MVRPAQAIVPDNLKSGVRRPCRYESDLNPSYQDFAEHHSIEILPARPYRPRDEAKVEVGIQGVERWIMATVPHFRKATRQLLRLRKALPHQHGRIRRPLAGVSYRVHSG